mmetsp:Transcript_33979/g.74841  ORF Transcript_33979/g.74841 Transcript_33979/m.74841 type:complete len:216 (+) Transcript_33979:72-719(+)
MVCPMLCTATLVCQYTVATLVCHYKVEMNALTRDGIGEKAGGTAAMQAEMIKIRNGSPLTRKYSTNVKGYRTNCCELCAYLCPALRKQLTLMTSSMSRASSRTALFWFSPFAQNSITLPDILSMYLLDSQKGATLFSSRPSCCWNRSLGIFLKVSRRFETMNRRMASTKPAASWNRSGAVRNCSQNSRNCPLSRELAHLCIIAMLGSLAILVGIM